MHILYKNNNYYINSVIIKPYMNCSICHRVQYNISLDINVLSFLKNNSRGIILLKSLNDLKYKISHKKYKLKIKEINTNIQKILYVYNIFPDVVWTYICTFLNLKSNYIINKELDYLINKLNNINIPNGININLFCNKCKFVNNYSNCLFCNNIELLNNNKLCNNCSYLINNNLYNRINNIIL